MPTYPLSGPPRAPATERLTLTFRQSAMESPYTLARQVVGGATQWQIEWTWPRMTRANAEKCAAWLTSLQGQIGTFYYAPRQPVTSTLSGRTLATTAFAYNSTVSIGGWVANAPSQLRAGQYFQIGNQLLQAVAVPANADNTGRCTVEFSTPLRKQLSAGTVVNFASPKGLFRLAASEGFGYTLDPDKLPEFGTILAREAVEV